MALGLTRAGMIIMDCLANEIYQSQCLLALNPQPFLFFFLTSKKKKCLLREVFILLIHCKLQKRKIKTKNEPLRKRRLGWIQSPQSWSPAAPCPYFILLVRKYQPVWREGKGWCHSSLSWVTTSPRELLKTPNPAAKLSILFSMLPELWNIHVSWSSPSGGSIAIDMTHKMSHPLMQRTFWACYMATIRNRKRKENQWCT